MQTVTLEVNESYINKFMALLEALPKDEIKIKEDTLKKDLAQRVADIDSGKTKLQSFDKEYSNSLDQFIDNIE